MKIVLQKAISSSGYCSRRKAEELIAQRKVRVNGAMAFLGEKVDDEDEITVNGEKISGKQEFVYIKLNKPTGYVCTNRSFKGEKSVFDLIDDENRLFVVGRLDKNSSGLVLLTNDGDLAQKLSHPRYEHEKVYEVKITGININSPFVIRELEKGIDIGDGDGVVRAENVKYLQNNIFTLSLREGKKRQIRRMFDALAYKVLDLKRVSIASLTLGDLKEGEYKYLNNNEITLLKNSAINKKTYEKKGNN